MITAITIKIASIPFHIYCREKTKRSRLKFSKIFILVSFHQPAKAPNPAAKLRIRPPAITDAICPETFTPIECIRRKF